MRMKALAFAIVTTLSHAAFAESKNEPVSDAEAQRYLAFFDQVVTTVSATKDNCPKMAGDLTKLFDQNTKVIEEASKAKEAGKQLPKAYDQRIKAGAVKLFEDLKTCKDDDAVRGVFKRFDKK